jgi:hypothetical protein
MYEISYHWGQVLFFISIFLAKKEVWQADKNLSVCYSTNVGRSQMVPYQVFQKLVICYIVVGVPKLDGQGYLHTYSLH